ncbi:MAG: response regulator transcription factor [Rhodopila sp.]
MNSILSTRQKRPIRKALFISALGAWGWVEQLRRGSSASPARLCRFAIDEGLSNKAMTRRLGISVHAIKFHVEALFAKLEATSRAEAVANGLRGDMIEL